MAKTYKTPGVYIEEISLLPPSIAEVATAIPAFIGYTEFAEKDTESLTNVPTRITSLLEYEQYFGKADKEENIEVNIADEYDADGNLIKRSVKVPGGFTPSVFKMYYSLQMFFANGGGPCYIISVADYTGGAVSKTDLEAGLAALEKEDEPTLIVFPDATSLSTVANFYALYSNALKQCNKLQDRFTIIDTYSEASTFADTLRTNISLETEFLKYGAVYYPYLKTTMPYRYDETDVTVNHTITNPPTPAPTSYDGGDLTAVKANTELYNLIRIEMDKISVTLPPSGAMAGIYARVDSSRGVWKAPANVGVMEVIGPNKRVTHEEQETLNVHETGKSINVIRTFAGKGTVVWGSRTLAGNDNEWRYVPVRRFFNFAEESIKKGSQWVVFEPNDANTWVRVKAMIENFLVKQWRLGALAGAKPEDAFFVKVGLGETMTSLDILEGRMNIEIGLAVVRPAEFIILKFSHKLQQS